MKRIFSILLFFSMAAALVSGCGNNKDNLGVGTSDIGGDINTTEENKNGDGTNGASGENNENTAMGRYVETAIDLSEYCIRTDSLTKYEDGTLVIPDYYNSPIVSRDNGETWEPEGTEWFTKLMKEDAYIMDMAYGPDGTAVVIYDKSDDNTDSEDDSNTDSEEDPAETKDSDNQDEESESEALGENETETDNSKEDEYRLDPVGFIVKPDGTQIPIQISVEEDDAYMRNVWVSDKGRIFVSTLGTNIYEIKEDGTAEKFLTIEDRTELIAFQGDLMIIDGSRFGDLILYDMEKKERVVDEVLNDFVSENYKERDVYNGSEFFDLYIFPGEEGVIYLAGKKGLHRHVIGGSTVEQIIDGSLSCFNNPSYSLHGMVTLPDNEFLALFGGGKLVRFTYNPDIPTVPNERVKVYSLEDNDTVRQAITIYQSNNPEVYVEYEVGLGEGNSITRDDALKKLNTQIMAGEGPDLLVLDDMPIDSYMSKGLLLDLSECLNSLNGENEIFESIKNAFKKDDKIYMIPCEIQLPMVQGDEKYISQMKDMKGIADAFEDLREDNEGKALVYACTEKGILGIFSMVCAPAWKTETGELNKESIEEFLLQCKRIYDAQMEGLPEKFLEDYELNNENLIAYYDTPRDNPDWIRSLDWFNYLSGKIQMVCGSLTDVNEYAEFRSIMRKKEFADDVYMPLDGQSKNIFIPKNLVGISAASNNIERTEELLKVLLGKENQSYLFKGMPVNKAALEGEFIIDEKYVSEEGIYSYIGASDQDGIMVDLEVYVLDENQQQELRDWIENVNMPYIVDTVLEEAVYKEGTKYLRGATSLDEAVKAIEQSVAIYMSE
ncbi:extracellular solute-binding protein [Parablautia muri]|uniref:Extracellular solute-binding protein n=1 Tax=Parablautia muri TaxID=2320879 RepID=A0A9X5BC73_9FIRM|nr:extracellular solute-binding protein [Parablautia muri]NBJ91040.1 extracellular solute-binding protein [Parablautia muri]